MPEASSDCKAVWLRRFIVGDRTIVVIHLARKESMDGRAPAESIHRLVRIFGLGAIHLALRGMQAGIRAIADQNSSMYRCDSVRRTSPEAL